jgi:hypothetical protein
MKPSQFRVLLSCIALLTLTSAEVLAQAPGEAEDAERFEQASGPASGVAGLEQGERRISLGGMIGWATDIEEVFIAADGRYLFWATQSWPVSLNAAINYYFTPEGVSLWQFDANGLVHYLIEDSIFQPYGGAGLAVLHTRVDVNGTLSETDLGLNVIAGTDFDFGMAVRPFAQLRLTIESDTFVGVMGGLSYDF